MPTMEACPCHCSLVDNMKMEMQSSNLNKNFHILVWPFYDHIKMKIEKLEKFDSRITL